jgi:PiT family inorganic phosphate transporter
MKIGMNVTLFAFICLALVYDFLNGLRDSSCITATIVSSRSMTLHQALIIVALAEFLGPILLGVEIAKTIGSELVFPQAVSLPVLLAALGSAIVWNLLTWKIGLPSSSSHALIGGILGAVTVQAGFGAIQLAGLAKILAALFLAPILGMLTGYFLMLLVRFFSRNASLRINWFFKRMQLITATILALSHGTNDAQKTMGMIALGLMVTGVLRSFVVPVWVIVISAVGISLGTLTGSMRMIKTLGGKLFKIRPVDAFTSQAAAAIVVFGASLAGGPVSITQVVSSTILGVGSAERINKIRWETAEEILRAWLLTIPVAGALGALFCWLLLKT